MRTMTRYFLVPLATAMLVLGTACHRPPLPCPDCDEQGQGEIEEQDGDEGSVPDLPCGGADLMTDNLNCGSCGYECDLYHRDTEWEAGSCRDGECGPEAWSGCYWETFGDTCAEICAGHGSTCLANGCAGLTVLLFDVAFNGCDNDPYATMAGSCDEPIPWESDGIFSTEVKCCCV